MRGDGEIMTPKLGQIVIDMGFIVTTFPAIWRTGAREGVTSRVMITPYVVWLVDSMVYELCSAKLWLPLRVRLLCGGNRD